jgi:very-short-patch-repair endonuclease
MDFLLLLSHGVRIVIEVDGLQHYADEERRGDPLRYAAMVRADRELRLSGYDVFRFGTAELRAPDGPERIRDFFERLFRRYGVRLS